MEAAGRGAYFGWSADAGRRRARRPAAAGTGLLQAASGERHALLLLTNQVVHACGDNSGGQLGRRGAPSGKQPGEPWAGARSAGGWVRAPWEPRATCGFVFPKGKRVCFGFQFTLMGNK